MHAAYSRCRHTAVPQWSLEYQRNTGRKSATAARTSATQIGQRRHQGASASARIAASRGTA
jgi:hypothetical protein